MLDESTHGIGFDLHGIIIVTEGEAGRCLGLTERGHEIIIQLTAYALVAKKKYFSLTVQNGKLAGLDRFGIVSPWATAVIKRKGSMASLSDVVSSSPAHGSMTIKDHILHYALDLDGDGVIKGASVGGQMIDVRATAIVWCGGRDGFIDPYPFAGGGRRGNSDDVYSWTPGQTRSVK
jgi:hypothetical protein